jgi:hypothetical protein
MNGRLLPDYREIHVDGFGGIIQGTGLFKGH